MALAWAARVCETERVRSHSCATTPSRLPPPSTAPEQGRDTAGTHCPRKELPPGAGTGTGTSQTHAASPRAAQPVRHGLFTVNATINSSSLLQHSGVHHGFPPQLSSIHSALCKQPSHKNELDFEIKFSKLHSNCLVKSTTKFTILDVSFQDTSFFYPFS